MQHGQGGQCPAIAPGVFTAIKKALYANGTLKRKAVTQIFKFDSCRSLIGCARSRPRPAAAGEAERPCVRLPKSMLRNKNDMKRPAGMIGTSYQGKGCRALVIGEVLATNPSPLAVEQPNEDLHGTSDDDGIEDEGVQFEEDDLLEATHTHLRGGSASFICHSVFHARTGSAAFE
eukprot:6082355-Amphidinium_carterae.2